MLNWTEFMGRGGLWCPANPSSSTSASSRGAGNQFRIGRSLCELQPQETNSFIGCLPYKPVVLMLYCFNVNIPSFLCLSFIPVSAHQRTEIPAFLTAHPWQAEQWLWAWFCLFFILTWVKSFTGPGSDSSIYRALLPGLSTICTKWKLYEKFVVLKTFNSLRKSSSALNSSLRIS